MRLGAIRRGEAGDVLAEGVPRADANEKLHDKSGIDDALAVPGQHRAPDQPWWETAPNLHSSHKHDGLQRGRPPNSELGHTELIALAKLPTLEHLSCWLTGMHAPRSVVPGRCPVS